MGRDFLKRGRRKLEEWNWAVGLFGGYCGEKLAESMVRRHIAAAVSEERALSCRDAVCALREDLLMFMEEEEIDDILAAVEDRESREKNEMAD